MPLIAAQRIMCSETSGWRSPTAPPGLHEALQRVADDGWAFVILDGELFDCDRLTETVLSCQRRHRRRMVFGKHRDFGANIQAVMRPDGLPIWISAAMPGHLHDLTCAQLLGVSAVLNWAATEVDLPTLADAGYDGAGQGIKTPVKQPADGKRLAVTNRSVNRPLRGLRWQGERGVATLTGRSKTLRHSTASHRRIGDIVAVALHLTHFEYRYLPESC